jgi:hypothetical protein
LFQSERMSELSIPLQRKNFPIDKPECKAKRVRFVSRDGPLQESPPSATRNSAAGPTKRERARPSCTDMNDHENVGLALWPFWAP